MTATELTSCLLSTQALVGLLRMPKVFGEARVVVLNHLGNRYHRKCTSHGEFVRNAKEPDLNPGLTTPPRRLDPKGLAGDILKPLGITQGSRCLCMVLR